MGLSMPRRMWSRTGGLKIQRRVKAIFLGGPAAQSQGAQKNRGGDPRPWFGQSHGPLRVSRDKE